MKLLNKNLVYTLGAMIIGATMLMSPNKAEAKWRLSDQIRSVHNGINSGISSLKGRMSTQAGAAGVYMEVGRSNDIFLFCKKGIPKDFWIAIDPSRGTYQITNYWYVNFQWIPHYVMICPHGGQAPGSWNGPGDGSTVPFTH